MFESVNIKKALYFAAEHHDGQYRKGGKVPYIVHPVLVAWGVSVYSDKEEIIIAALLHDILEDCINVTESMIHNSFGSDVLRLVKEVSFLEEEIVSWREKKEAYLKKIRTLSENALIIIAVDKMSNMKAYFEAVENGVDVDKFFGGSLEEYEWYYRSIGDIIANHSNKKLVTSYQGYIQRYIEK